MCPLVYNNMIMMGVSPILITGCGVHNGSECVVVTKSRLLLGAVSSYPVM